MIYSRGKADLIRHEPVAPTIVRNLSAVMHFTRKKEKENRPTVGVVQELREFNGI